MGNYRNNRGLAAPLTLVRRLLFILPAYVALVLLCAFIWLGWGRKEAAKLWEENTLKSGVSRTTL